MALTLYRNGSVYSAADPFATALLVDGDTVAWVGSEHAATSLADDRMRLVDLQGALVTPGFVDSHVHVTETGLALGSLDLAGTPSLAHALDAVAAAVAAAGPGIVLGHGWDETAWPEARALSAAELDRAGGGREIYLARVDVHSGVVSSALAQRLGLTALPGWDGEGVVRGRAHQVARDAARALTPHDRVTVQQRALRHAASRGYVAVAEMSAPHVGSGADLASLAALSAVDAPEPFVEVLPYWGQAIGSAAEGRAVLAELGTPVLGLAGDLNIDGSLGSRTALLRAPYADAPGTRGTAHLTLEQITDHLVATSELGITGGFHIIGDAAMDLAVEGLAKAAERVGLDRVRAAGHRFEHAMMADGAALAALAHHAVTVSLQPAFDAAWGGADGLYAARLGQERAATVNPVASFYAAGVPLCFGSDTPVTGLTPWASVRAALTHQQPEQRISARAAFIGHTRAGWRAAGQHNPLLGQLVPGAPASFAIWEVEELMVQVADERVQSWSTDPRARTPLLPALDTEHAPRCLQTVHRGRELFAAADFR